MAPPLFRKKIGLPNGINHLNFTSWQALLGGILVGITIGTTLSMLLFTKPTPLLNEKKEPFAMPRVVPDEKEQPTEKKSEATTKVQELRDPNQIIQEFINQDLAPARKVPQLKLHEGTRALSEYERKGGWRLTPDVLKVAQQDPRAQVVSEGHPFIIQFKQFLSQDEIAHMLETASTHMSRSKVVSGKHGSEKDSRTSYGAWLNGQYRDSTVENIEQRIHNAVGIPLDFGEGIYVLRYEKDQKYEPHTDNCARHGEGPKDACMNFLKRAGGPECGENYGGASCGDRIATFIMYLKSPTKGGATVFPNAKISEDRIMKAGRNMRLYTFAEFCSSPLYFKVLPEPGDALFFWDYIPKPDITNHETFPRTGSYEWTNQTTEAINDGGSLHGGCPVLEGEKWIATKWIRSSHFV